MFFNAYWAYGLRIHAEIECPELLPVALAEENFAAGIPDAEHPDVTIRLVPVTALFEPPSKEIHYETKPGIFALSIPDVARYRVEEGRRITIEILNGAQMEKVRLFLLGSVMGALLYQRGLFPLHGSAVETPWGAMIFVGAQGAGKSTLAAQFHRRGYRLLSDDVCAVKETTDGLRILPALAQFRLCADAYERLGTPDSALFHVDKFLVPMGAGYCPVPMPLTAIHILFYHESELPSFVPVRGFDRVQRLVENLYRPQYLKGQETQLDLMRLAGRIAQQTMLVSVSRRRDPLAIDGLVDFLESAWEENFAAMAVEERK